MVPFLVIMESTREKVFSLVFCFCIPLSLSFCSPRACTGFAATALRIARYQLNPTCKILSGWTALAQ